jgi:hypothetical protein
MADCSQTRESYGSHKSIGAASRYHNATSRQKTYENAEQKSVVNWAPITRVLCSQTCTFYVTRLAKPKRKQIPQNKMLVTHLWLLRVHLCIHLHIYQRASYALPHSLPAGHLASKPFCTNISIIISNTGQQCMKWIEDARTVKHVVKQQTGRPSKHNFIK